MRFLILTIISLALASPASAQSSGDPSIEACRTTGLIALKEQSPSIKDLIFDIDSLVVSKANTNVENVPIRTVVLGEAYIERKEIGKGRRLCVCSGKREKCC
jgi:hypothetical protein